MALSNDTFYDLYEGLKHNFLFKNDLNSIHILLNLYDIEDNIRNIFPKYVSIKYLRNHISRILKNRLELLLYLEGYKGGFVNIKEANRLEDLTVKTYSINELYYQKYLFHFDTFTEPIQDLRDEIFANLEKEEETSNHLHNLIGRYCEKVIRNKIFSLNRYLDKQLTIDYESSSANITEDETLLTMDDLTNVYNEVIKIMSRNGMRLYKDAYWNGLNDRVLKRYR
jgi:hypothetical protein